MSDSASAAETPAEVLRRAAKLMRERAGAATPGPWEHPLPGDVTHGYRQEGSRHIATWIASTDAGDEDADEDGNAEHIASWHPLVALAVAEWLECAAALIDATVFPHDDEAITKYPLTVARVYIGGETPA